MIVKENDFRSKSFENMIDKYLKNPIKREDFFCYSFYKAHKESESQLISFEWDTLNEDSLVNEFKRQGITI